MFRRDPKNIKGPLPGWSLIEEPDIKPQVKELSSSAENRTAFFMGSNLSGSSSDKPRQFLETLLTESLQTECGSVVIAGVFCGTPGVIECRYNQAQLYENPIYPRDAVEISFEPCTFRKNGLTFSCGAARL